jgi:hypothetical protein
MSTSATPFTFTVPTERTWTSEFVRPLFIDDSLGKGLRPMLEREKDMPPEVRREVEKELEAMEDEGYVV